MRCINRKALSLIVCFCLMLSVCTGCGQKTVLSNPFDQTGVVASGNANNTEFDESGTRYLAEDYCTVTSDDVLIDSVSNSYVKAAGAFNVTTGETLYSYNTLKQCYPASTTKVMTAYLVFKYGKLSDKVTISSDAVDLPSGSASAGLATGDELTVKALLYGLLLASGNDAANALAEYISGSVEEFAKLMNAEAKQMGAMHSNFVNANGIQDEDHYTCVYDLYLIFQNAMEEEDFLKILKTKSKTVTIKRANGESIKQKYVSSNGFLTGKYQYPDEYEILGGKTGTTYDAGKCLVLLAKNEEGQDIVFVALGSDTRDHLYLFLNNLMNGVMKKSLK